MKEHLKSIFLAFLVLFSLFLTYRLWYGEWRHVETVDYRYEPVFFEETRPLAAALTPERIWLYHSEGQSLLCPGSTCFNAAWEEVSQKLQQQHRYEYRALEGVENLEPCLRLRFAPPLPVGSGTPWLKEDRYRELHEIMAWCREGETWISLQEPGETGETALILPGELAPGLGYSPEKDCHYTLLSPEILPPELAEAISWDEEIYIPAGETILPVFYLKQELQEQDLLLKTFFVERSMIRVINERDGTVIYTDGEKGLRVGVGVEYSDPSCERNQSSYTYLAALGAAANYLSYYGGWPVELRLETLALNQSEPLLFPWRSCRAEWGAYFEGLPLRGRGPAAVVVFNDSGLVKYRRLVFQSLGPAGEPVPVSPFPEALAAALALYEQEVEGPVAKESVLEAVELVYAITGPDYQLIAAPAWAITLNGRRLMLQAATLSLLEENLQ